MLDTGADMVCCRHVNEWKDSSVHPKSDQQVRVFEGDEIIAELIQRNAIGNVAWGKLYRAKALADITYPDGRAFEDMFTTHRICKRICKATCLPDELFHYRIRSSGIVRTRSVANLVDYWLAHTRRQEDLQDVPDELQTILARNRISAAFIAWCWLASCPRVERHSAQREIGAMSRFARESLTAVVFGEFNLKTKVKCVACTVPSSAVWIPLNLLMQARRRLSNRMMPYE
jgi:hypothetical protein